VTSLTVIPQNVFVDRRFTLSAYPIWKLFLHYVLILSEFPRKGVLRRKWNPGKPCKGWCVAGTGDEIQIYKHWAIVVDVLL